jgi:hypothetical protein
MLVMVIQKKHILSTSGSLYNIYIYYLHIYIYFFSSISDGPKKSGPGTPIAGWFIMENPYGNG